MNKEVLVAYLQDELGVDTSDVDQSTLLFSTGIVDSFGLVEVVLFIEKHSGIKVNPMDVNLDNLDSIDRIIEFVNRASGPSTK